MTEAEQPSPQPATDELTRRKDALLEATLPNVLFDGWSSKALHSGAMTLHLPPEEVEILFPGGAEDARQWLDDWADRKMLEHLAATDLSLLRMHERIGAALKARFAVLAPHREAVRRAVAGRISPTGAVRTTGAVYRTVDAIWRALGDTSTDFSFYSKRGILGAVYSASMLYWLNDHSEGFADTDDFIDRRLLDVMQIPKLKAAVRSSLRPFLAPFDLLRRGLRR